MRYYFTEKLDKQILKRVPYCASIAILMKIASISIPINLALLTFTVFLFSTFLFNQEITKKIQSQLFNENLREFRKKFKNICEGKSSIIDDISDIKKNPWLVYGIVSGLSLTFLLTCVFLYILGNMYISKEFEAGVLILMLICIVYDIETSSLLEYNEEKDKIPLIKDVVSKYIVGNSTKYISPKVLLFLSRIAGPIGSPNVSKIKFEILLLYQNEDIDNYIKNLIIIDKDKNRKNDFITLEHKEGLEDIFALYQKKPERISMLIERSPKDMFPYLLDPNYSFEDENKKGFKGGFKYWTCFSIKENDQKIAGYLFIHVFRGAFIKRKIKTSGKLSSKISERHVYLFILLGKKEVVEYLKNEMEILSPKFDLSWLNVEIDRY